MFAFTELQAQEEVYHAEIGINGGGSYYLGDANSIPFNNIQPAFGVIYRQKFNPRFAAHLSWSYTSIEGTGVINNSTNIDFANTINALDLCGEFNFFDLEKKEYKPFSKTYSPFIYAGVGYMFYPYNGTNESMYSYIFGVGFKKMLSSRFNLNVMWTHRLLLTDQMEGVIQLDNLPHLNGSNLFNDDLLSTLTIGITFNIWKDKCDCLTSKY